MRARVFISCGQKGAEQDAARQVARWFTDNGFDPYVALEAQSIQDINAWVIGELRRADYFVFVDFRREPLPPAAGQEARYRGSLFSHQELAIAYALGFEHCLFFRQTGVQMEGIGAYVASNATSFDHPSELVALVSDSVLHRKWDPSYSRSLVVANLQFPAGLLRYGSLEGRFLYVDIENHRPDAGAPSTVVRLARIRDPSGAWRDSPIRSPLKVTGERLTFEQTIWPRSHGAVDLLCVEHKMGSRVFLNSALDKTPLPWIIDAPGSHLLLYEAFADGFGVLKFGVNLTLAKRCEDARAELLPSMEE